VFARDYEYTEHSVYDVVLNQNGYQVGQLEGDGYFITPTTNTGIVCLPLAVPPIPLLNSLYNQTDVVCQYPWWTNYTLPFDAVMTSVNDTFYCTSTPLPINTTCFPALVYANWSLVNSSLASTCLLCAPDPANADLQTAWWAILLYIVAAIFIVVCILVLYQMCTRPKPPGQQKNSKGTSAGRSRSRSTNRTKKGKEYQETNNNDDV